MTNGEIELAAIGIIAAVARGDDEGAAISETDRVGRPAGESAMNWRDRWFDLTTVHIRRPFVPEDRARYRTFFDSFENFTLVGNEGTAGDWVVLDGGTVDGGIDKWVPRWQVRRFERRGWSRVGC